MTKEEKIKESWGGLPLNELNRITINDGWLYYGYACNGWDDVQEYLKSFNCDVNRDNYEMRYDQCDNGDLVNVHVRPKTLKGIENNNGWIKIESEADLPKESWNYWIMQSDNRVQTMKEYDDNKKYFNVTATHYQPIDKPKTPIY